MGGVAPQKLTQGEMPLADHAFYGLVWAATTLTEQVGQALHEAHGLSLAWFEVMLWLAHQPEPVSASALGNSTMLSRSQVSRVLDALEARRFVSRTPSPKDGRSVEVALTRAGRQAFTAADETRRHRLTPLFTDPLDDADLAALDAIWRKLKRRRAG